VFVTHAQKQYFVVLGIEPRALCMLKQMVYQSQPQTLCFESHSLIQVTVSKENCLHMYSKDFW
jgi:hypothetical protein